VPLEGSKSHIFIIYFRLQICLSGLVKVSFGVQARLKGAGVLDLFPEGVPCIPPEANFFAFFTAGGEIFVFFKRWKRKIIYFIAGRSLLAGWVPPFGGRGAPYVRTAEPHVRGLKVQKVHR
jgi:hypothetical protein